MVSEVVGGARHGLAQLSRPWSGAALAVLLKVLDILAVIAVALVCHETIVQEGHAGADNFRLYLGAAVVGALTASAVWHLSGAYRGEFLFTRRLRVDRIFLGWLATIGLLLVVAFLFKLSESYSRLWAVAWFAATCAVLGLVRVGLGLKVRDWVERGFFAQRTVIVGAGPHGDRLARHLREQGDPRTRLIGFVDERATRHALEEAEAEYLGDVERLIAMIRRGLVDQVFVALPWRAEARIRDIIDRIAITTVPIRLGPDFVGFQFPDRSFSSVARLPMLNLFDRPLSGWSQLLKEIEDRILAVLLLVFLAPLLCVIATAIKLDSPGPVLFRQKRHGLNHNLIDVWKFRTMYVDQTDCDCHRQTLRNDPRVTRVGRFLRRSSLDELPQLFNVLFGDMSIVGPRPHAVATKAEGKLFEEVVERYAARHRVKPGITGWAQVNGWRGETDTVEKIRKRVEYDLYYIDHWSVWFDVRILALTALVLWRDDNAY